MEDEDGELRWRMKMGSYDGDYGRSYDGGLRWRNMTTNYDGGL
jgi:hypothetical protein